MNRTQLIAAVGERAGLTPEGARRAVEALFGTAAAAGILAEVLARGERVQMHGFGTFAPRHRSARQGLDPRTRRRILVPATTAAAFRASAALREHLNPRNAGPGPGVQDPEAGAPA